MTRIQGEQTGFAERARQAASETSQRVESASEPTSIDHHPSGSHEIIPDRPMIEPQSDEPTTYEREKSKFIEKVRRFAIDQINNHPIVKDKS